jgi:hypothetical protein
MIFANNDSKTKYYEADPSIFTWQGICSADNKDEFLITGTLKDGFGAVYKGTIDVPDVTNIKTVKYPNSTSTAVYGPEYISHFLLEDTITLVGSYQTGEIGLTEPCVGFGYKGKYNDFDNPNNYFTIEPDISSKYTVVHSTRGGLAVYITSNFSQLNLVIGKSFIFDIDKKQTIAEVLFPKSLYTTTYGIWHNRTFDCFDTYTISGGFSLDNVLTDTRTFVVDLLYNKLTGETQFENWTEIKIPGINILTHAQGITGLDNGHYILPIVNFYLHPLSNELAKFSGAKIEIKRENNGFVFFDYESINYPDSLISIVTSAAQNSVVGVSLDSDYETLSFQAVSH